MKEEEIYSLNQIVLAIEQAESLLEESYKRGDKIKFSQAKKLILNLNKEIEGILE
jgi:exonuclease VII small subunit